jgi:hypothetical protein
MKEALTNLEANLKLQMENLNAQVEQLSRIRDQTSICSEFHDQDEIGAYPTVQSLKEQILKLN